jgi:hypothetical protein
MRNKNLEIIFLVPIVIVWLLMALIQFSLFCYHIFFSLPSFPFSLISFKINERLFEQRMMKGTSYVFRENKNY